MNDRTDGAPGAKHDGSAAQTSGPKLAGPAQRPSPAKSGGTRAQERIAALDSRDASSVQQLEQLRAALEEAEQRAAEAQAGWQRARADYANLKRRVEEERLETGIAASDRLLGRVVELVDDFDLAIEHVPSDAKGSPWVEGIAAIDRKLRALLEAEGVRPMRGEGEPFDPHTQQAISYEAAGDAPDGTVTKVLKRGYSINGRVLRPALVAVARNDDSTSADDATSAAGSTSAAETSAPETSGSEGTTGRQGTTASDDTTGRQGTTASDDTSGRQGTTGSDDTTGTDAPAGDGAPTQA